MCDFPTPSDPHSYGLWDKSKNPYLLRNRIIPNSATVGPQRPLSLWPCDSRARTVALSGIMSFLKRYGFLLY